MTALGDQTPALTAEYDFDQPVGTVSGHARLLVHLLGRAPVGAA